MPLQEITFKKIVLVPICVLILSFYYGEKAKDLGFSLVKTIFQKKSESSKTGVKLFTTDDLKLYNGVDKPELYLALLGIVFDVSKGSKYYGPDQEYNVFVGRDASRSFVTGNFNEEDVTDKVDDLSQNDLRSLNHWLKFYKKDYVKVGKLIGKYFDEKGKSTPYRKVVIDLIKAAQSAKDQENLEKVKFPSCNVEWDAEKGTRVWCSANSGGVARDWVGVPRQLFEAGSQDYRCACISEENENLGNIKEYDGCDAHSTSCFVKS